MPLKFNLSLLLFISFLLILTGCVKNKDRKQEDSYSQNDRPIRHGQELFNQHCASCHNFQNDGIGPNLSGVIAEKDTKWLRSFIANAPQMIKNGDARAVELYEQYNKQYMPAFPMLEKGDIASLLAYIETQQHTNLEKEKKERTGTLEDPIPERISSSDLNLVVKRILTIPPSTEAPPLARINKLAAIESKGEDRLFVHDLRGKLHEIKDNEANIYLDLPKNKQNFIDYPGLGSGFGSFAFHPDFKNNGLFYTTHTEPKGTASADFPIPDSIPVGLQWVLLEWKADDGQAREFKGSHRELLRADMHSGIHGFQDLKFNPIAEEGDADYGLLYLDIGDGGATLGGYPFLISPMSRLPAISPFYAFTCIYVSCFMGTNKIPHHWNNIISQQFIPTYTYNSLIKVSKFIQKRKSCNSSSIWSNPVFTRFTFR